MVRACFSWGASISTICRSLSGIGILSTIVRPRATRRCFTWSMTSDTSRTTWSPCSEMAPDLVSLQEADQGCLRSGVRRDPELGERVGGDELPDLCLDQSVDSAGHRSHQGLQARPVGDDAGEHLVEDRFDVDLLLDRSR